MYTKKEGIYHIRYMHVRNQLDPRGMWVKGINLQQWNSSQHPSRLGRITIKYGHTAKRHDISVCSYCTRVYIHRNSSHDKSTISKSSRSLNWMLTSPVAVCDNTSPPNHLPCLKTSSFNGPESIGFSKLQRSKGVNLDTCTGWENPSSVEREFGSHSVAKEGDGILYIS